MGLLDRHLLHTPVSGGTRALAGTALLDRLAALALIGPRLFLCLLCLFVSAGIAIFLFAAGLLCLVRRITAILALPRITAARRARTVARILIEPLVRGLQIRQQLRR
jgi:hypothetical protein